MLEPSQNEYKREREGTIKKNLRRMEELGISGLSSSLNSFSRKKTTSNGESSGKKGKGSDLSDYILEGEEHDDGDDDTDLEEEPIPLAIESPVRNGRRKVYTNKRKTSGAMAPGGRHSKRVRSIPPTEVTPGASVRLLKRLQTSGPHEKPVQKELPPVAENTSGDDNVVQEELLTVAENTSGDDNVNNHSSPLRDWSYPYDADHDDAPDLNEDETGPNTDSRQSESTTEGGPSKVRPATRGVLLDKMTKAMGRRMPISGAEGNTRPHESLQAAKFASEAGVIVKSQVPIFPHWKDYKEGIEHFEGFLKRLSGRLAIGRRDKATSDACVSVFKSRIRQRWYKLKQEHFVGVPTNEILTTSHNKRNRAKVKWPQATGSHYYVAQLHSSRTKNKDAELAEVNEDEPQEQKGMSDVAREAFVSMKTMRAEPVADGQPPLSSANMISKVLSQNRSNTTFLNNTSIPTSSSKSQSAGEEALSQELASEKQGSAILHQQVEELKKKTEATEEVLARTQRQYEELKKQHDESNVILMKILNLNTHGTSSQL
uniref:Uncharacterized protein n=2 Tax=Setaria italica TaxID=4555 RepID=K4A0Y5_SETIT